MVWVSEIKKKAEAAGVFLKIVSFLKYFKFNTLVFVFLCLFYVSIDFLCLVYLDF